MTDHSVNTFFGSVIIPLNDVQHAEQHTNPANGLLVVMKSTRWDMDRDCWENGIWLLETEALAFAEAFAKFQHWRLINAK